MTDKEKLIKIKLLADKMSDTAFNMTTDASLLRKAMDDYHQFIINEYHKEEQIIKEVQEEPVSERLEDFAKRQADEFAEREYEGGSYDRGCLSKGYYWGCKAGAKWKVENLWKPADGDDLPDIGREVIVLIKYNAQHNIHDEEYQTYRVGFGHRPNPNGWDGKNIETNEVTHYTPKLYDKGGWNAPNIVYWLDVELPKEIEEL